MNSKQMKEFMKALESIVEEKKVDKNIVIESMEQAMAAAYKKETGMPNVTAKVDPVTGDIRLYSNRTVVEEVTNEETEISLEDAQKLVEGIELGEVIIGNELQIPTNFGRVAAGTAKQIVVQRIKEAEKQSISEEFQDKEGELMVGTLSREDQNNYFVDLGRCSGILPKDQIIPGEKLEMGSSVKVYVSKLEIGPKGPFIMLSRSHYGFVKRLFEHEIPEVANGTIVITQVVREAGVRTKVALYSTNDRIDAIGSCIGERGSRIAGILKELKGEKVDLVLYSEDPVEFIKNAMTPAKDVIVSIPDAEERNALVIVNNDNLSQAIGKKGSNIKLASKLTKYHLEIKTMEEIQKAGNN